MLWAQWGMVDKLKADPGIWLCHQCNDCNVRCPRDAQPGDVLQSLRSIVVQELAAPKLMGRLVGNIKKSWPLLVLAPLVFWLVLLGVTTGLAIPIIDPELPALEGLYHYEAFVPHAHIYIVYTLISLWVVVAAVIGGKRLWDGMGRGVERSGSFLANLGPALVDILAHRQFAKCGDGSEKRKLGHLGVMWGFIGAAVTSGLLIPYLYRDTYFSWLPLPFSHDYPLPLSHPVKWLGNISAVILVVGGILLLFNRFQSNRKAGDTNAFDRFFLWTVLAVIFTGVLTEVLRFVAPPIVGCSVYVLHLSVVMTLFITFPYSKFAHLIYRTLAMVHQRMVEAAQTK